MSLSFLVPVRQAGTQEDATHAKGRGREASPGGVKRFLAHRVGFLSHTPSHCRVRRSPDFTNTPLTRGRAARVGNAKARAPPEV